jgi:hypothetical protein
MLRDRSIVVVRRSSYPINADGKNKMMKKQRRSEGKKLQRIIIFITYFQTPLFCRVVGRALKCPFSNDHPTG